MVDRVYLRPAALSVGTYLTKSGARFVSGVLHSIHDPCLCTLMIWYGCVTIARTKSYHIYAIRVIRVRRNRINNISHHKIVSSETVNIGEHSQH